jgi:WD40 repeat protein
MATTYTFTIRATDSSVPPQTADRTFSLTVDIKALLAVGQGLEPNIEVLQSPGYAPVFSSLPSPVTETAFSPDGTKMAVGMDDGKVRIYSTSNWALLRTITVGLGPRVNVAFSPNSQYLAATATRSDNDAYRLAVYEVSSGTLETFYDTGSVEEEIAGMAFDPVADVIAIVVYEQENFYLRLLDSSDMSLISETLLTPSVVQFTLGSRIKTRYSPDGSFIAIASGSLKVFNVNTSTLVSLPIIPSLAVDFSPDAAILASLHPQWGVVLINTATWTTITSFDARMAQPRDLSYAPDGDMISVVGNTFPFIRMFFPSGVPVYPDLRLSAAATNVQFSPIL